ncbi:MAG: rhodanese-related sulfurtransferase [Chlamydiales bacterium]
MDDYHVIAFYAFFPVEDPHLEVKRQKKFLSERDMRGRIYISEEGYNGQLSASPDASKEYIAWMKDDPRFADVQFKIQTFHEHPFDRVTVKYREQIVAMDEKVDMQLTGEHVAPEKWREMLESRDEDTILIDVRNNYESEVGHFEGAECPDLETFREFPEYANQLAKRLDTKNTKVMMYCTGGIRCELYSSLMKERGFENVYQLDGGVINYGLQEGAKHWKGKLFVFDDRMVVPISEDNDEVLTVCKDCGVSCDHYFNCARMDCNDLFISCLECAKKARGCCSESCLKEGRVRPFNPDHAPRPYRRLSKEEKEHLAGA